MGYAESYVKVVDMGSGYFLGYGTSYGEGYVESYGKGVT